MKIVRRYWKWEVKCWVAMSFLKEVSQKKIELATLILKELLQQSFFFELRNSYVAECLAHNFIFEGSLAEKVSFWAADFSRFEAVFFPLPGLFPLPPGIFSASGVFLVSGVLFPLPQGLFSLRQKVFSSHRNELFPLRKKIVLTPKGIFHVSGIFPLSILFSRCQKVFFPLRRRV